MSEQNPLKPQRVRFKTPEEITREYRDKLRVAQTTLTPHVHNHKIEEYEEPEEDTEEDDLEDESPQVDGEDSDLEDEK